MKIFNVYKENSRLKEELEDLRERYDVVSGQNSLLFSEIDFYQSKLEKNEGQNEELRYKVLQLMHENTELLESKLIKEKNKLSKDKERIKSIQSFIEELEYNKEVDKNNNIDTSVVVIDYVIERLHDIIK